MKKILCLAISLFITGCTEVQTQAYDTAPPVIQHTSLQLILELHKTTQKEVLSAIGYPTEVSYGGWTDYTYKTCSMSGNVLLKVIVVDKNKDIPNMETILACGAAKDQLSLSFKEDDGKLDSWHIF